jgi:hypothetical protein
MQEKNISIRERGVSVKWPLEGSTLGGQELKQHGYNSNSQVK